jgi:hypothetical protein
MKASYFVGREPLMRISTSLLALCCQSGVEGVVVLPRQMAPAMNRATARSNDTMIRSTVIRVMCRQE